MEIINIITIFGGINGFLYFLYYLETSQMGNIIIRNNVFSPLNILKLVINPFYKWYLWHPYLWKANWIIMIFISSITFRYAYLYTIYLLTKD